MRRFLSKIHEYHLHNDEVSAFKATYLHWSYESPYAAGVMDGLGSEGRFVMEMLPHLKVAYKCSPCRKFDGGKETDGPGS